MKVVPSEMPIASSKAGAKQSQGISSVRDYLGITASIACAIHCAAMPLVIGLLPTWGVSFLAGESFHQWMAIICLGIGLTAFIPGWRRHRKWLPAAVGTAGLLIVGSTAFFGTDNCCPDCSTAVVTLASTDSGEVAEQVCTEECCENCPPVVTDDQALANAAAESNGLIGSIGKSQLLSAHAFWLTPFGGLLLVAGHLMNHRSGCRCEDCDFGHSGEPQSLDG